MADEIIIDPYNWDPMDTLVPLLPSLPTKKVPNTPENRLKAALSCCYQLTMRLQKAEVRLNALDLQLSQISQTQS